MKRYQVQFNPYDSGETDIVYDTYDADCLEKAIKKAQRLMEFESGVEVIDLQTGKSVYK